MTQSRYREISRSATDSATDVIHDSVVFHPGDRHPDCHDTVTKASLAGSLARLLGIGMAMTPDIRRRPGGRPYFVPTDTLDHPEASRLGIGDVDDLFGGVTPMPYVATKVITHPLAGHDAAAPMGWTPTFGKRVRDAVLAGYSVFSARDARLGAAELLSGGAIRVKDAAGVGGSGQTVVDDMAGLENLLTSIDADGLRHRGFVLERNLNRVQTFSVGQVQVAAWRIAYFGRQRLTRNHHGKDVYGGSSLRVVRGCIDALLACDLPDEVRIAVEQALVYHQSAMDSFPGLFASRCNYDVAQGIDDCGVWRSGVLEQSWRIGGASGAELAALHAMRDEPALRWVDASTHEIYADEVSIPSHAEVHYDGTDPKVGRLVKYAMVDAHGDT